MKITVHHQKENDSNDCNSHPRLVGYFVAVETFCLLDPNKSLDTMNDDILNWMWSKTNHREDSWTKNFHADEIGIPQDHDHRSSMVGDIFQIDDRFWLVDRVGFVEIYPSSADFGNHPKLEQWEMQLMENVAGSLPGVRVHRTVKNDPNANEPQFIFMQWGWEECRQYPYDATQFVAYKKVAEAGVTSMESLLDKNLL